MRTRSRTRVFAAAAVLALAACDGDGPDGGAAGAGGRTARTGAVSSCDGDSWIAGVTELCDGHLVHRDYVYDDYGADSGLPSFPPISEGLLSPAAGDVRYPAGTENTADIVRLELWLDGGNVRLEVELNTLYEPDQTIVALALDTDDDPATGGGPWPGLGISSEGWDEIHVFSTGDPATNLVTGSFPRPGGGRWTIRAVAAQANGTVMNVAFRGTHEEAAAQGLPTEGAFWEDRQAAALGRGDVSEFAASVDVADLERRVTRGMPIEPGFHQRVYTSPYTLPPGEGIATGGVPGRHGDTGSPCEQLFHYLGRYQPYGIYVPDQPGPHGLQLVLHGCAANHSSLVNQPGMQQRFGEDRNRILVVPLGRGPVGFYSDISERDVLDVMADVSAHYEIDENEVIAGGYSMGGYGALRLAALHPGRFAAVTNWVGFTGDLLNAPLPGNPLAGSARIGAVGNVIDFLGNLRHVPSVHLYGALDELVHVTSALALQTRLAAEEVESDFYLHVDAEHLTFALLDDWAKESAFSAGRHRVRNPSRVTFRTDPALDYPEYEITHDAAYWVSDLRGRSEGVVDVDVTSHGCGHAQPVLDTGSDAGVDPVPLVWIRQSRTITSETTSPPDDRLEATLRNVSSFRIDTARACLDDGPVSYAIDTDGPVAIDLDDGRTLSLPGAGVHEGVL